MIHNENVFLELCHLMEIGLGSEGESEMITHLVAKPGFLLSGNRNDGYCSNTFEKTVQMCGLEVVAQVPGYSIPPQS
jgi:hypothetical protein